MKRTLLAVLGLLLLLPAALAAQHGRQRDIRRLLASEARCGIALEDSVFMILNASSPVDCDTTGEADPELRQTALCICDGGAARAVGIAGVAAATTTTSGIVRLATDGETTGSDVVQASDSRLDQISAPVSRSVRVDPNLTANGSTIFNTLAAAATYVSNQSPLKAAPWRILLQGDGSHYVDSGTSITLPEWTEVKCDRGQGIYANGDAAAIETLSFTSGTFLTMQSGTGISNCQIIVGGTPVGARNAVQCKSNNQPCVLDHVGIYSTTAAGIDDVAILVDNDPGLYPVAHLYYVVTTPAGSNTSYVGVKVGANGFLNYDNGLISDGGGARSKGIQFTSNTPAYGWINRVTIGAPYNVSKFATDISVEGTGYLRAVSSNYVTKVGTVEDETEFRPRKVAAVGTCDATRVPVIVYDTTTNEFCGCSGASPAWAALDGSGTCD